MKAQTSAGDRTKIHKTNFSIEFHVILKTFGSCATINIISHLILSQDFRVEDVPMWIIYHKLYPSIKKERLLLQL